MDLGKLFNRNIYFAFSFLHLRLSTRCLISPDLLNTYFYLYCGFGEVGLKSVVFRYAENMYPLRNVALNFSCSLMPVPHTLK